MSKAKNSQQHSKLPRLHPAPFMGLGVALSMLALFNAQVIAAYVVMWTQPAVQEVQAAPAVEPATEDKKNKAATKDPLVVMPAAGIKAPVVYGMNSIAEADVQHALEKGVLHFGNSALPGQEGNAVYVGHSSGQPWAPGDYKFVFTMLQRLNPGDKVQLAHEGELYEYEVTEKIIVDPIDVSVLEQTRSATATFITCWPVGMNAQRLVIKSKLTSHEPRANENVRHGAPELQGALPGDSYNATEALQERLR